MKFAAPLVEGRLVKRYTRFLADVELEGGGAITARDPSRHPWLDTGTRRT